MKGLKQLWARRPRLSRGGQVLRNLILILLLAGLTLVWNGWPGFAGRLAYRQLEAKYLLTPSQVVYQAPKLSNFSSGYLFLTEGAGWITAGGTMDTNGSGAYRFAAPSISYVLAKEGVVVVPLPFGNEEGAMVVAVWGAPPEAVSGRLEVDLDGVEAIPASTVVLDETFAAQAERRTDGWFLFTLFPHDGHSGGEMCAMDALWLHVTTPFNGPGERPYRLTLADGQGNEVFQQRGSFPPADRQLTD